MKKDITIKNGYVENGLGYWNPATAEIVIDIDQSREEKDIVLIHEAMHAVAEILKQAGHIKKLPDHRFIETAASNLLHIFKLAKRWKN